jgi:prefoldin subunit 5
MTSTSELSLLSIEELEKSLASVRIKLDEEEKNLTLVADYIKVFGDEADKEHEDMKESLDGLDRRVKYLRKRQEELETYLNSRKTRMSGYQAAYAQEDTTTSQ